MIFNFFPSLRSSLFHFALCRALTLNATVLLSTQPASTVGASWPLCNTQLSFLLMGEGGIFIAMRTNLNYVLILTTNHSSLLSVWCWECTLLRKQWPLSLFTRSTYFPAFFPLSVLPYALQHIFLFLFRNGGWEMGHYENYKLLFVSTHESSK